MKNQLNWRVLGYDEETGGIKLIAGTPLRSDESDGYLTMYGAQAYITGYDVPNKISDKLYGEEEYVAKARSVKIDDINELVGINSDDDIKEYDANPAMSDGQMLRYGDTYTVYGYTPESYLASEAQKDISDSINQYWIFEPVVRDRNFGQKYALANYDNHLKTYPNLESAGGDCTNFASQCLLAQGIHMVDNWYIYKKNTMFESPSNVLTLRLTWDTGDPAPWINANDFKDYWGAYHVEKAVACTGDWLYNNIQSMYEETKLGVGDIIQLAYITGDGGLGSAHHTMVVSSVKSNNGKNVYHIAEHTNSAYDKSIEEIAKDNKNEYFIFYKFYD